MRERGKVREAYLQWDKEIPVAYQPTETDRQKAARENYERVAAEERAFAIAELNRREGREPVTLKPGKISQTDTPAFREWFGNSKVVDESGKPLVVYHGTSGDFDVFRPSRMGEFGP